MHERNFLINLQSTLTLAQRLRLLNSAAYQRSLNQLDPDAPCYITLPHERLRCLFSALNCIFDEMTGIPPSLALDPQQPVSAPTADRIFVAASAMHEVQPGLLYAVVQLKHPDSNQWVLQLHCSNLALANAIAAYTHQHCGQIPSQMPRTAQTYCVQIRLANPNPLYFTAIWEQSHGQTGWTAFRQLLTQLQIDQSKLPFLERL